MRGGPGTATKRTKLKEHADGYCHGPGCSRSRRVTGSYGRSTGIEDLVDTSREHGRSAVSMETMDFYGLTCKGGPSHMRGGSSTATRRTKLKEQAQPRRGPSSRSMQMVTTQGLERQESKESTPGPEEEEQCRRSRHQVWRRRSSVKGVDTTQEAQGCQASRIARRRSSVEGVNTAQEA
ncbi:hypothetical protein NDA11_005009 [Ustilago hordei]|nr:hypothetical protein NDA12_002410 [Ustilago hordei]KAJ1589196.1 hypothetical protein NDA15_003285 [Ustilago hordei]KAJ1591006.1 hypothetical protein NDA11_005009 [Ustilago hordei]